VSIVLPFLSSVLGVERVASMLSGDSGRLSANPVEVPEYETQRRELFGHFARAGTMAWRQPNRLGTGSKWDVYWGDSGPWEGGKYEPSVV
jgi:hypothetical protein